MVNVSGDMESRVPFPHSSISLGWSCISDPTPPTRRSRRHCRNNACDRINIPFCHLLSSVEGVRSVRFGNWAAVRWRRPASLKRTARVGRGLAGLGGGGDQVASHRPDAFRVWNYDYTSLIVGRLHCLCGCARLFSLSPSRGDPDVRSSLVPFGARLRAFFRRDCERCV